MKLAIVVQRYGADIGGGSELHARYLAEHLGRHADVRVLTTCARDYVTWRNDLPAGEERVNGVPVERFPVSHEREPATFRRLSSCVFTMRHSVQDELDWYDAGGPRSVDLIRRLQRRADEFDWVLLFSIRYYQAFHGARVRPEKAVLIPTAERDPALGLTVAAHVFRGVRAVMYNSFEEQAAVQAVSGNADVPGVVVGIGSDIPEHVDPERFRQAFDVHGPFVIYIGRIDANKGCEQLFEYFTRHAQAATRPVTLLLAGVQVMPVPSHPRIRYLGFLSDRDKFDAIAAADALIMPSFYESLSMVALEAWALGRPVLANARCDVLLGQCLRSNAGLYYGDAEEFSAALETIVSDVGVASALGRHGRDYYARHYSWPVIERKYLDMFDHLQEENARGVRSRMTPLPGPWRRRRRNMPPAAEVVEALPSGPSMADDRLPEVS